MYELRSGAFLTPGGHQVTMEYRDDTNDWNTLTSCLTEDEYGLPSGLYGVAFDIGGHIGSIAIALAMDNPDLRVVVVEPLPPNLELLRQNISLNGVRSRVHVIEGAVGKGTVEVAYGYTDSDAGRHHAFIGNTALIGDEPPGATVSYPALTLSQLVGMAGDEVAFLKIDTEGAEFDFLDDPAAGGVKTIVGEWHNTHGTQADLAALLEPTHTVSFTGTQAGPGGFRAERR